jgi:hypothetical protein
MTAWWGRAALFSRELTSCQKQKAIKVQKRQSAIFLLTIFLKSGAML